MAQGGAAAFDELTALVPASIRINQISVSRSRADLTAIQNELSPYLTSGLADSKIVGIGQDIKSNQVEIEVAGDPSSVSEWLKSNYGDSAYARSGSVELASCPASNSCMPWRGGIQMTGYVNGVAQEECTYTLNARNPNGYLFALTAGHCEGSSTRTWQHTNQVIGSDGLNTLDQGNECAYADAMRIKLVDQSGSQAYLNKLYFSSTDQTHSITGTKNSGNIQLYDPIEWTGQVSWPYSYGSVQMLDHLDSLNGCGVNEHRFMFYPGYGWYRPQGGDSGGPVYWNNYLWGNVVASGVIGTQGYGLFGAADLIEDELNLTFCHSATC